jgi:hypothetical protein
MQGFKCSTPSLSVAAAFPALEALAVVGMPLTYMDLEHLSACTQLTSLELDSCNVTAETVSSQGTTKSPLAAVSSIRQLKLSGVSSTTACGLTQLTSLHVESEYGTAADCIGNIGGMHNLQQLRVITAKNWVTVVSMPVLQQLVTTASQLRVLELPNSLGQQEMDLLLTHATQLTHLTCVELDVTEDRSQAACSWAELITLVGSFNELAYLPLHSIQQLEWGDLELPSPCPCLEVAMYEDQEEASETLSIIRAAVTNLGRCPAWQLSGPTVKCELVVDEGYPDDSQSVTETVAALSGLTNKQLELSINDTDEVWFNASLIQQLGRALGSSLTRLEVTSGHISRDFWPAVWAHLPGLQQLSLGPCIDRDTIFSEDIAAFCTHAAHPLQLSLHNGLSGMVCPPGRLQAMGSIWGRPHVTVVFY